MRWNASREESSFSPQKDIGNTKAQFFCQPLVIQAPILHCPWGCSGPGAPVGWECVFSSFCWRNRFEVQGGSLLIHCSLFIQAVQHQCPRTLRFIWRSYDVWGACSGNQSPAFFPVRAEGLCGWAKWCFHSWSGWSGTASAVGESTRHLPSVILWSSLQFQDCRSLLGEEKREYVWVPQSGKKITTGLWVLLNGLNTDLLIYLQNSAWIWREGRRLQQELLPETGACCVLFELVLCVRACWGSCQIGESWIRTGSGLKWAASC